MKKIFYLFVFILVPLYQNLSAQTKTTLNPTITPALFRYNDQITVAYDVTGTSLAGLTSAYVWVWMPGITGSGTNSKYNIDPATSAADPAKCTRIGNTFSITFKPSDFFASDISAQTQMGILLKGSAFANGQTTDYLATFFTGAFQAKLLSPTTQPLFTSNGNQIQVQATASDNSKYVLKVNGKGIDSASAIKDYSHTLNVSDSVLSYQVSLSVNSVSGDTVLSFSYLIPQNSPTATRPAGIIDGINYNPSDQTKVTLCFWAPNKSSVYAFGDFTDWNVDSKYLMNKDGEHFWVEVDGLTPGQEYAFQYLVNDTLRIADPYTDKILEPEDNQIPSTTYPNLKPFPAKALSSQGYYNHLSVFQTGQTPYQWQTTGYQKPAKEKLVIYELLIRDFFDSDHRNFQTLIDTISYFKRLGVNAIELMPVAEFNGEIGWGYNPTSMFAVEKYYGTKNKLKEFVDKCHAQGIAVIMDLVMNHQDLPNSYAMLDYDFVNGHPKATNKWFNVSAPHPYSVFNDLNHDSPYTRKYLDTINYYWLHEFNIDGFRYDLSKGFTQTYSLGGSPTAEAYDQSRINNLTRMADAIWANFPDAYVILEHFTANSEEAVLANYQVDQGRGMMPWGNFNYAYGQNAMGFLSGSDISQMFYGNKGWTAPRNVGYMESHDEEREVYRELNFGSGSGTYSIKSKSVALHRMEAAALMFYAIPGPKMLWEFGELGYDFSINTCQDGSVNNNCRLDPKPVHWDYLQDPARKSLWNRVSDLIHLRKKYNVFSSTGIAQISSGGTSLVQQLNLKNTPYTSTPSDSSQMNAVAVANFDVTNQLAQVTFPHTGVWYDYYNNGTVITISSTTYPVSLQPGDYKLFTDVKIKTPSVITAINDVSKIEVNFYPNPTQGQLMIESDNRIVSIQARSITGTMITPTRVDQNTWDVSSLTSGLYIIEINTDAGVVRKKLIKN